MNNSHTKINQYQSQNKPQNTRASQKHFKNQLILQKRRQSAPRIGTNIRSILNTSKPQKQAISSPKQTQDKYQTTQKPSSSRTSTPTPHITDPPFLKYYEQNIHLKQKQKQLGVQLSKLKDQLNQKHQIKKKQQQHQLFQLASAQKSTFCVMKSQTPPRILKNKTNNLHDQNKISNLLQIIQHYKQKLLISQQRQNDLKKQKYLLEQDIRLKQIKIQQIIQHYKQSPNFQHNSSQFKQKYNTFNKMYDIQKQKNKFHQIHIKKLQSQIKMQDFKNQQLDHLKTVNRNLQEKIFKLTQLSTIHNTNLPQKFTYKQKQYEQKYHSLTQQYTTLKTQHIKSQAQLKLLKNQLISLSYQSDQLQKQNIKLKSQQNSNPILNQLAQDKQLLGKVFYQMKNNKNNYTNHKNQITKQNYQKLILQKQSLANELVLLQNKLYGLQSILKQKQQNFYLEKQDIITNLKNKSPNSSPKSHNHKIITKSGIPYTDDVTMFTNSTSTIPPNSNYFDLYLGQLHLLQSMLTTSFNIRTPQTALILATVDFYNHNIQTTNPVTGTHCNLQSQFSFKITQDLFFLKYLNKSTFNLQIWCSQGNKRINLGKSIIQLQPLLLKNQKNFAPVVHASTPIYLNKKVMGSINYVMRMRLPINDLIQKVNQCDQICTNDEQAPSRKLVIQIQQGRGFPQNSHTFVYFSFRLQDFYTKTFKGTNPSWNYHKTLDIRYNTDLKNYLRKNDLEFVILDNNADGDSDVIGSASVPLIPLLQNSLIKQRITIKKGTLKVGQIDIRIYWSQQQTTIKQQLHSQQSLSQDIRQYIQNTKISIDELFTQIDQNKTGIINIEQFSSWIKKITNKKLSNNNIISYYKNFNQPLTLINFKQYINKFCQKNQIIQQLSKINRMFEENTEEINKNKLNINNFLKNKLIDINAIQNNQQNNKYLYQQIISYFNQYHLDIPQEILNNQSINMIQFIQKYQHNQII